LWFNLFFTYLREKHKYEWLKHDLNLNFYPRSWLKIIYLKMNFLIIFLSPLSTVVQISFEQIWKGFCAENEFVTNGSETFVLGLKMLTLTLGLELIEEQIRFSWVLFPKEIFLEIDAVILL